MSPLIMSLFLALLIAPAALAQETSATTPPAEAASVPAADSAAATAPSSFNSGLNSEAITVEDSLTLRDPFKRPAKFADPGSDQSLPELERYALDQIKIVGIITGPKKAKALVSTPSNKMFIVQENDKIGVYQGVIRKIKEKSILVREKVVNLVGQEESTDNEIFLKTSADADAGGAQRQTTKPPRRM